MLLFAIFFFKQKTAYDVRISDWSSDVCSSDLPGWTLVAGGYSPDRVISDRSIGPLVRLGLIALAVDLPVRMIVTAQGKETWALFCQRGGMYPEDLARKSVG